MEDNDDDVECITPGPVVPPKINNPPPLVSRSLPEFSNENIVQMTENDVTVNALTGGLKFRVDPQTLSSKKMYRLPDGRIFAINPNPNMPGGYSATIVSVSDSGGKTAAKGGETFAAKLSAVTSGPSPSGSNSKPRNSNARKQKTKATQGTKGHKTKEPEEPRCSDFKVPVEWYRYNLIDAVDALDYSLSRLNKLKKEATTGYLRTRNIDEIKYLHRTLEQLLSTSSKRFLEIRENLNRELKTYISKKTRSNAGDLTEDDDDVEFLPNAGNDDPIFIDENSIDSVNINESQEVDLTGVGSSEHNDSTDNRNDSDPLVCNEELTDKDNNTNDSFKDALRDTLSPNLTGDDKINDKAADMIDEQNSDSEKQKASSGDTQSGKPKDNQDLDKTQDEKNDKEDSNLTKNINQNDKNSNNSKDGDETGSDVEEDFKLSAGLITGQKTGETNGEVEKEDVNVDHNEQNGSKNKADSDDKQSQDSEMSEEMIETLLKDNDTLGGIDISNSLDILDDFEDKQ